MLLSMQHGRCRGRAAPAAQPHHVEGVGGGVVQPEVVAEGAEWRGESELGPRLALQGSV